jgi:hypothetical protein
MLSGRHRSEEVDGVSTLEPEEMAICIFPFAISMLQVVNQSEAENVLRGDDGPQRQLQMSISASTVNQFDESHSRRCTVSGVSGGKYTNNERFVGR